MAEDVLNQLESLKTILNKDLKYGGVLQSLIGGDIPEIPSGISNTFLNASLINELYGFAFLGYEALDEEAIVNQYRNKEDKLSFFGAYEYTNNYKLTEDMRIYQEDTPDDELVDPEVIDDVSKIFPLFKFQGDYIVVDMRPNYFGSLLTIVDGHICSFFAPSICDHIVDLTEGLREEVYEFIDDEIVYPTSWYQRKKARSLF